MADGLDSPRGRELAENLRTLRARINGACAAAGRAPREVRLLPVTKTFPVEDAALLHALGERDFGESKVQEATAKVDALAALVGGGGDVRWHMLGRVQRNKAGAVARWAGVVHSVDSARLLEALDRAADAALASGVRNDLPRILIQVSLDGDPSRGGVPVGTLDDLCERASAASMLDFVGLMAVPPLSVEPERAFAALAGIRERVLLHHPEARELSAGMSGDLELAVHYGSTCVRVGTALLGRRPITSP